MNNVELLIRSASQYHVLHKKEELDLVRDWQNNGTKESFDIIINSNVRFVVHIALQYGSNLPLEDLVQEGVIGMIRSLDKFDPELGFRVVTFAKMQIRSAIYGYIISHKKTTEIMEPESDMVVDCISDEIIKENIISAKMKDIYDVIEKLTDIEKRVIMNYIMYEKESFDDIARVYGISKTKVNFIYRSAIRKLKNNMYIGNKGNIYNGR